MSPRRYSYIGPAEIKQRAQRGSHCLNVTNVSDLSRWVTAAASSGRKNENVTATFVIDVTEQLWIADRRSEHVACAAGQEVLAAGEITFTRISGSIQVTEITNQSTGYCPEPNCWSVVACVLDRLQIVHPPAFTPSFDFRRCDHCGTTNLIKDNVFSCAVCDTPLSRDWNFLDKA
jgi:hypothetical protein